MEKEEEFEVEAILDESIDDFGKRFYLIKWKDYTKPTWEKEANVENCQNKLKEYFKNNPPLVFVKDMQKQLPIPTLQPQPASYYRARKLHLNNFGIYDCSNFLMHCMIWSEYVANTKGDDICR